MLIVCAKTAFAQLESFPQKLARESTPTFDSLIQSCVDQTNLDSLIQTVDVLSGEDSVAINDSTYLILSRYREHPHNDLAAEYIYQRLTRLGLATYSQQYDSTGRNVYAVKNGTDHPDKKVTICAHYDDYPMISPGADDNASGVAAVLEAARILSKVRTPYTIIFACWDEEEGDPFIGSGMRGSSYFAQKARESAEDITGVVNLDMLGWDGNSDGLFDIHTKPIANTTQLGELVKGLATVYCSGLTPAIYSPLLSPSDHTAFWGQGYTAVVISEAKLGGDFNPFVHSSDDKRILFNLEYFHAMSKLAMATIVFLSLHDNTVDYADGEHTSACAFALEQNCPNPFNPSTTIKYELPRSSMVELSAYDILGREVSVLVNERRDAGVHQVKFDATDLSSGVYFYQMRAGEFVQTKKLLLVH